MTYYKNLPLNSLSNCRDLGGYPTKYGKITSFGVFVRSEAPVKMDAYDINFLKDYGVTKSLDFRGDENTKDFPSCLDCESFEYIQIPMFGRADALGFSDKMKNPIANFDGWGKNYIIWSETYKGWIKDVFAHLATTEGACHFNCNAGKDRTGIIAGLILAVAGVSFNDIAFDYSISRSLLKPRFKDLAPQWAPYLKDKNGNLIVDHPFLYTPKVAMIEFLKYLESEYESVEGYLLSCGVDPLYIETIRKKLNK